jgi:ATP-dependent DNA ligase
MAGKSHVEYELRWDGLLNAVKRANEFGNRVQAIEHTVVHSLKEAYAVCQKYTSNNEEGAIFKNPRATWRDNSSGSSDEVKVKVVFEADYKITGIYEGEGKARGMLGGVSIASCDDLIQSNCGIGFDDATRKKLWSLGADYLVGKVVTVSANDIIKREGRETESLFLPVYCELRLDKHVADSYARCVEQFNAAKEGLNDC